MNRSLLIVLIILGLAAILFFVRRAQQEEPPAPQPKTTTTKKDPSSEVNRNHGFDRRVSYIEYTHHAECRMKCRKISQAEVEDIMRRGTINYKKSDVNARPCPTYALEGVTDDDQRVRIVFAQCDFKTKVITCIDLGTDWSCDCPGDDKKHQNSK